MSLATIIIKKLKKLTKVFKKPTFHFTAEIAEQRLISDIKWMSAKELLEKHPALVRQLYDGVTDESRHPGSQLKPHWNKMALQLGSYYLSELNKPDMAAIFYQASLPSKAMIDMSADNMIVQFPKIVADLLKLPKDVILLQEWGIICSKLITHYLDRQEYANALICYERVIRQPNFLDIIKPEQLFSLGNYFLHAMNDRRRALEFFTVLRNFPSYREDAEKMLHVASTEKDSLRVTELSTFKNLQRTEGNTMDFNRNNNKKIPKIKFGLERIGLDNLIESSKESNETNLCFFINDDKSVWYETKVGNEIIRNKFGGEDLDDIDGLPNETKLSRLIDENKLNDITDLEEEAISKLFSKRCHILPEKHSDFFEAVKKIIEKCKKELDKDKNYYDVKKGTWGLNTYNRRRTNIETLEKEINKQQELTRYYSDNRLRELCEEIVNQESPLKTFSFYKTLIVELEKLSIKLLKGKIKARQGIEEVLYNDHFVLKKKFAETKDDLLETKNQIIVRDTKLKKLTENFNEVNSDYGSLKNQFKDKLLTQIEIHKQKLDKEYSDNLINLNKEVIELQSKSNIQEDNFKQTFSEQEKKFKKEIVEQQKNYTQEINVQKNLVGIMTKKIDVLQEEAQKEKHQFEKKIEEQKKVNEDLSQKLECVQEEARKEKQQFEKKLEEQKKEFDNKLEEQKKEFDNKLEDKLKEQKKDFIKTMKEEMLSNKQNNSSTSTEISELSIEDSVTPETPSLLHRNKNIVPNGSYPSPFLQAGLKNSGVQFEFENSPPWPENTNSLNSNDKSINTNSNSFGKNQNIIFNQPFSVTNDTLQKIQRHELGYLAQLPYSIIKKINKLIDDLQVLGINYDIENAKDKIEGWTKQCKSGGGGVRSKDVLEMIELYDEIKSNMNNKTVGGNSLKIENDIIFNNTLN